jgi:hypothetical protein
MKRFILLSIALIISLIAKSQNSRIESSIRTPISNCPYMVDGNNTTGFNFLDLNEHFRILLSKPWKLDQMYINEVATVDSSFANVYLALEFPSTLVWVRTYNGINSGKDYPAKFSFEGFVQSQKDCLLSEIYTYHKYNNSLMDTYMVQYISDKVLILISNQTDTNDPIRTNKIEYRFVPKL